MACAILAQALFWVPGTPTRGHAGPTKAPLEVLLRGHAWGPEAEVGIPG